jgi:hypothetical protein
VTGVRRVIVGASGSPGSLRALRYADERARAHDATLIPVLTWLPPGVSWPTGAVRVVTCAASGGRTLVSGSGMPLLQSGEKYLTIRRSTLLCTGARLAGFWSVWLAALMTCWLWVLAVVVRWPGWSLER